MIDKDQRCQGCGAPIRGRTCEYCGRMFEVEYDTIENVLYADNIPIMIEKTSSQLDRLQYQASQERQIAFLENTMKAMNNVFPYRTSIDKAMETRWEKSIRKCK